MRCNHGAVIRSDRAVFRLPGISFLIPFLFFIAVTPLANAGSGLYLAFYLLPLGGLIYILITRTVADTSAITTTGLTGIKRISWTDLDGFEFRGPRWATAVALDGRRMRLPMVRPRDMPRLARVSGGRLLLGKDAPPVSEPTDGDPNAVSSADQGPDTTADHEAGASADHVADTSADRGPDQHDG